MRILSSIVAVLTVLLFASATPAQESGPAEVRVGAYVNDIQQLDLQSHSYNFDLYIWFKWTDPEIDPVFTLEFMNSFELWGHIITYETEEPVELDDGSFYMVLRNQGKFNSKLPLEQYPFDTQALLVEFESNAWDSSELVFVPDDDPVAINADMTLPGYTLGTPRLIVIDKAYTTDFGDPTGEVLPSYSRVQVVVPVSRPAFTYAIKLLLPMLLVAFSAGLLFMVRPTFVEGRIGIGITALLTLVALQITSNDNLPEVDYLMLIDKIYIASYAFVVAGLAIAARTSWIDSERDIVGAARADRRYVSALGFGYVLVMGIILIAALA